MPRSSLGNTVRIRARWLFEALLDLLLSKNPQDTGRNLTSSWQNMAPESGTEVVIENMTLSDLADAVNAGNYKLVYQPIQFETDKQSPQELIRGILNNVFQDFLKILVDKKNEPPSDRWAFTLHLWSKSDKETNLKEFDRYWEWCKVNGSPEEFTLLQPQPSENQNRDRASLALESVTLSDTPQNSDNEVNDSNSTGTPEATSPPDQPPSSTPNNIPRSGVREGSFIGRDEVLKDLDAALQNDHQVAITAVKGMSGVGKTELAIQYCLQHLSAYTGGICWVRARGENEQDIQGKVASEIVQFAISDLALDNLPTGEGVTPLTKVRFCWRNWPGANTPVLIVLDDLNNYAAIRDYLPKYQRFKVLITTRSQLGGSLSTIELDILKPHSSLRLFQSLFDEECNQKRIREDPWIARAIVKWIGYLPLGIELVGRYLDRNQDLPLHEMLHRLESKRLEQEALKDPVAEEEMTAQLGVKAAIALSWDELNDPAQRLACLLSLFALDPIPWVLVKLTASDQTSEELEATRDKQLIYLSLLKRTDEDTYQLHQLIREFFKEELEQLASADHLKQGFCRAMAQVAKEIPTISTQSDIQEVSPTIPHMVEAAIAQDWLRDEDLVYPFSGLSNFYANQGIYEQAKFWQQECLKVVQNRLGKEHYYVTLNLNNLAYLYQCQGNYSEAKSLFIQALKLLKRLFGENHPLLVASFNGLIVVYTMQGNYSEAESLCLQALQLSLRLTGGNDHWFATLLNNLAEIYKYQKRYSEAELFYIKSLGLRKRLWGEDHPDVVESLNNLAQLYAFQGSFSKAEPLYIKSLKLRKHLLGAEHPAVAISLNNLADVYISQEKYSEAEPLLIESLSILRRLFGNDHPEVGTSLNNLANVYISQGKYSEAKSLYLQALGLFEHFFGDKHPNTIKVQQNLDDLRNNTDLEF